jgi:predicted membrane-bound mannosyltransferase
MGNIMPVLQEQAKAQREGMIKRQDALSALQAAQLAQRVGLANQDVTTATAMAKIDAAANKPVRGIAVGDTLRNPFTNEVMGAEFNRVPMPDYYKALEAAPTTENLQAAVAYYPTFAVQLKAAYERGLKNKGR